MFVPIGGYKGSGLALVLGLLAGPLNRAAFGRDIKDVNTEQASETNTGQFVIALDVARFLPLDQFGAEVDRHMRDLAASTRLPGVDEIRIPGQGRQARRADRQRERRAVVGGAGQAARRGCQIARHRGPGARVLEPWPTDRRQRLAGSPFWRFSLRFYRQPGVAEACIALQEESGVDVNLLLFLLWHAAQRRRLSVAEIERLERKIGAWRDLAVIPLRAIRRALKSPPGLVEAGPRKHSAPGSRR